jgi:hypothetical protein
LRKPKKLLHFISLKTREELVVTILLRGHGSEKINRDYNSVDIPGGRQEDTQARRASSEPKGSFVSDLGDDIADGWFSSM